MTDLSNPIFTDETAARKHLEAIRWPDGPVCPYCGTIDAASEMGGKDAGTGWYSCRACRKKYTVRVGSVYERSHIPLHKWVLATHLVCSSKKGISAHQLHRMLGITYKSAWFMAHRIREAMKPAGKEPMGGSGKVVEADETYIGRKPGKTKKAGYHHKLAVVTLVERDGKARSFHVDKATVASVMPILRTNVDRKTAIMTDESKIYTQVRDEFASHQSVNHEKKQWRHGNAHTNTIEGFFSVFKRGMKGVYQHCDEQHLQRYLTEFDFRYNHRAALNVSDDERAVAAHKGAEGKRLTYRRTPSA
jgi:transposase-like protein